MRLVRGPRAWVPIALWVGVAILGAVLVHTRGAAHASDHALLGAYSDIALPLLAYAIVSASLAGDGLVRSGRSLVAFGAHPAKVALGAIAVAVLVSALLAALTGAGVVLLTHGEGDPPLANDLLTTGWASLLGAAAYASWFCLGASFGARGGGRAVFLGIDWILGSGHGVIAALLPRGNLRNLLGGEAPLALSQGASVGMLVGLTVVLAGLAALRARR